MFAVTWILKDKSNNKFDELIESVLFQSMKIPTKSKLLTKIWIEGTYGIMVKSSLMLFRFDIFI